MRIDFNSDLAEGAGSDEEILKLISSVNVCCGLHAGGYKEILKTIKRASELNLRIGAHPGYDDRANFGRVNENLSDEELKALLAYQLGALREVCKTYGAKLSYVKPHGALYNMACVDFKLALKIAQFIADFDDSLALMGLSNSCLIDAAQKTGIASISEVFADRRYTDEGLLVSRSKQNAVIKDENEATQQVITMIKDGYVLSENGKKVPLKAQSLCLHGDNEKAIAFAKKIKTTLENNKISIGAF